MSELKIGGCISFQKSNLKQVIEDTLHIGGNAVMFYVGGPSSGFKPKLNKKLISEGLEFAKENNISVDNMVIHGNYISNFASPEEEKREMAMGLLRKEIDLAMEIGIKWLVIHPGSYTTGNLKDGIQHVANCLNHVLKETDNVVLCLETMAGKGKEIGRDFMELQCIIEKIELQNKIGVCVDTCHINDAGYDIQNHIDDVIRELDGLIGLDKVHIIHLNNSMNQINSKKDRHSNIYDGTINPEVLYNLTRHPQLQNKIWILESKNTSLFSQEVQFFKQSKYNRKALNE